MAQRTVGTATTSEVTAGNQIEFSVHSKHFRRNMRPPIGIHGLAGAETALLWKQVAGSWKEATDSNGDQITFTADYETDVVNGPGVYGITKDATVAAVTITLDDGI